MPRNSRSNNQYYGKYFECCIVSALNKEEIEYKENYSFTKEEKENIFKEAQKVAHFLGNHTATYVGNQTANESGDLILDNQEVIEIKRVSQGTGTYFNTSIYYLQKFGFDFKQYLKNYNYYDKLRENFKGVCFINERANSPVSQSDSSLIRHNYEDIYNREIKPLDLSIRKKFTEDFYNYLKNNTDKMYEFVSDMLNKNTETSKKQAPDRIIIYNYTKDTINEIVFKDLLNNCSEELKCSDTGISFGNLRVQFSWQNGAGLNNPTIRVFI